ncbi:MAG: DNA gyrase subunit A, partial [Moraxellaceae bacterium]
INTVALVDGQPRTLNLLELIQYFVRHRREVVTRRTVYLLRKARERGHVLEGLAVAIANIDEVIITIKNSQTPNEARDALLSRGWPVGLVSQFIERAGAGACRPDGLPAEMGMRDGVYYLSPAQVQAILDLRLHRLTGMEHDKLLTEYEEKLKLIGEYLDILANSTRLMEVIREELVQIGTDYSDARRTEIQDSLLDLTEEDLITEEDRVVTISHGGYAKTQPISAYQAQRRGGMGKVYWLKVYQIPVASRTSRGRPVVNLLPLDEGERITAILPVREFDENKFIFMATSQGTVKKSSLAQFARPRSVGLRAIELDEGDHLVGTSITDGSCDVLLFASNGKAARFREVAVRETGRTSRGVRGILLAEG